MCSFVKVLLKMQKSQAVDEHEHFRVLRGSCNLACNLSQELGGTWFIVLRTLIMLFL